MKHDPAASTHPRTDVLRAAVAALTARDTRALAACLHDDVVFELPYEANVPVLDKDGFLQLLDAAVFALYAKFAIDLTHVYDLRDDDSLIARYESDCVGASDGVRYANNYVGIFEFRDGLICSWREYDNPAIVTAAKAQHDRAGLG